MARQQVVPANADEELDDTLQGHTEGDETPAGVMFENNQDGLVVDLAGVEEFVWENLPAGKYNVIVEDCNFAMSKSSGKPMWNLKLNVIDEEYQNRKLFTIFSFSEGALPGTKAAIAVLEASQERELGARAQPRTPGGPVPRGRPGNRYVDHR